MNRLLNYVNGSWLKAQGLWLMAHGQGGPTIRGGGGAPPGSLPGPGAPPGPGAGLAPLGHDP